MILDIIAGVFWYGIILTPLIAYFIVRKFEDVSTIAKILIGFLIMLILSIIFFVIAIEIIFRDGMGPT
jgi:hypothetical protein